MSVRNFKPKTRDSFLHLRDAVMQRCAIAEMQSSGDAATKRRGKRATHDIAQHHQDPDVVHVPHLFDSLVDVFWVEAVVLEAA